MRHGRYAQPPGVPSAHLPHPLIEAGRADARLGAELVMKAAAMHGWQIHPVVDASSLLRAWETAHIAAECLSRAQQGVPFSVEEHAELVERGLGSAANLRVEEIEAIVCRDPRLSPLPPDWKADSSFRLPLLGAETLIEAGERVASHLERRLAVLPADAGPATVQLFVGHGAAFRHAAAALGVLPLRALQGLSMHHCRPVFLERLADGRWVHLAGRWKQRDRIPGGDERLD
jgi:broad specificity phosphatase PhoE